jgi:hypothetical protein
MKNVKRHSLIISLFRAVGVAVLTFAMLSASATAKSPERPHAGTCDATVTPLTQGFPLLLSIDLSCHLRHLGLTTGVIAQEVFPTGDAVDGVVPLAIVSDITYTAANGDVLKSHYVATGTMNFVTGEVTFEGVETFKGGSGRFTDASGSSFLEGTASIFTNEGAYTTVGRIRY